MIHLANELHYVSGTECDLLLDKVMESPKLSPVSSKLYELLTLGTFN